MPSFSIFIPDARGRELSGGDHNSLDLMTQRSDLSAIIKELSIDCIFGHSRGALLALDTVNYIEVDRIVAYEPPIAVNGKWPFSTKWIPKFEDDLRKGDGMTALARYMRGMSFGQMDLMPIALVKPAVRQEAFHAQYPTPLPASNQLLITPFAS